MRFVKDYLFQSISLLWWSGDIPKGNSFRIANNYEELKKRGISHVVTVTSLIKPRYPEEFEYLVIPVEDLSYENILKYFPASFTFINEALKLKQGRVLVHCMAGISRSATIVVAYLMKEHKYEVEQAIALCKQRRSIISPNQGFKRQLLMYQEMGCLLDYQSEKYQNFELISSTATSVVKGNRSSIFKEGLNNLYSQDLSPPPSATEAAQTMSVGRNYTIRCKKCSRVLGHSELINITHSHQISSSGGGTNNRHTNEPLFVEPLPWMLKQMLANNDVALEGKLECTKCLAKVGYFSWKGVECGCGKWVIPAFGLSKSKIDQLFLL